MVSAGSYIFIFIILEPQFGGPYFCKSGHIVSVVLQYWLFFFGRLDLIVIQIDSENVLLK